MNRIINDAINFLKAHTMAAIWIGLVALALVIFAWVLSQR